MLEDLFKAYYGARRNKRNTFNALNFEIDYEKKLFDLYRDIRSRNYKLGKSICFIVNRPVKREIFAADFRDRVVHHFLFNYLNPLCEKMFIYDSYACREGKGTYMGVKRVDKFIRKASLNYKRECFILKMDIRGYFMSIDKKILWEKILGILDRFKEEIKFDLETVEYLLEKVIWHNPTKFYHIKGDKRDWIGLPKNKSLFWAEEGKGLPIGNLTSQLFGNIYLHDFDRVAGNGELGFAGGGNILWKIRG